MKIYEKRPVSILKKTLVKTVCDICGKEIIKNADYYEVTTGHNDWGSDSHESENEHDICSDECLQKEFKTYLDYVSDSKFIEVTKQ